jgi:hypothetical protein
MAIDPLARKVLDGNGIEVVRAKYIKEIAVTGDTEDDLNKPIAFGNDKVRLGDVAEWLGEKAKQNSRWTKFAPTVGWIIAGTVLLVAACNLWYTISNYNAQNRPRLEVSNLYLPENEPNTFTVTVLNRGNEDATEIGLKFAAVDLGKRTVTPITEKAWSRLKIGQNDRVTFKINGADSLDSMIFLRTCIIYTDDRHINFSDGNGDFDAVSHLPRPNNFMSLPPTRSDYDVLIASFSCTKP